MGTIPVIELLIAAEEYGMNRSPIPTERFADRASEEEVCEQMEDLTSAGLLEYGVSARTGWATPAGAAYIREHAPDWARKKSNARRLARLEYPTA